MRNSEITILEEKSCSESSLKKNFVQKLYSVLETNLHHDVIDWDASGTLIELKDPTLIQKEILPKYFNHTKYASFMRQFGYYGFKRISQSRGDRTYSHQYFRRNRADLLDQIKRINTTQTKPFDSESTVLQEQPNIKTSELQSKVETLTLEVESLRSRYYYYLDYIHRYWNFQKAQANLPREEPNIINSHPYQNITSYPTNYMANSSPVYQQLQTDQPSRFDGSDNADYLSPVHHQQQIYRNQMVNTPEHFPRQVYSFTHEENSFQFGTQTQQNYPKIDPPNPNFLPDEY